jgi:N-acetylmuramoyl-L-alanine amidase
MLDSRRLLLVVLIPLLLCQAAWGKPAVLDVRLGRHPDATRLVIELSGPTAYRVGLLASPNRLYVELPPADIRVRQLPSGRGLVRSLALGSANGLSRLTARLAGPVKFVRVDLIRGAEDGASRRLVIDLAPATAAEFGSVLTAGPIDSRPSLVVAGPSAPPLAQASDTGMGSTSAGPANLPALRPAPMLPGVMLASTGSAAARQAAAAVAPGPTAAQPPAMAWSGPLPMLKPTPEGPPLIYIDPGHGGIDPGTIGVSGSYEKDIVLALAKELQRELLATGRYRVKLTREADQFVALRPRFEMARADHADLFISLHANSKLFGDPRGLSVYTLSETGSDSEADALATKENKADLINGVDLSKQTGAVTSILIDLAQRETKNLSARFAELLDHELGRVTQLLPNAHRFAGFAVLKAPDIPSVLIEVGYLSNAQDEALLLSAQHRAKLAGAMLRAIDGYFTVLASSGRS